MMEAAELEVVKRWARAGGIRRVRGIEQRWRGSDVAVLVLLVGAACACAGAAAALFVVRAWGC